VYISRDVVFYEAIFPFEKLHDNAGRRLQKEIGLLPPTLLNPNTYLGVNYTNDHVLNSPNVLVFPGEEVYLSQEQIAAANQAGSRPAWNIRMIQVAQLRPHMCLRPCLRKRHPGTRALKALELI
jgi:hypothetical protein